MSGRALLSVEADIAAVQRAFGALRSDSRSVSEAIAADFRRIDESGSRAYRRIRREAGKAAEAMAAAERYAAEAAEGASRRRQQIAATEGNYRTNALRRSGEEANRAEEEVTRSTERQSRRRLSTIEREARERARIIRRYESRGAAAGRQLFSGAVQAGSAIAGEVRSERSRVATTERSMGLALYQAGAGRAEVAASTRRVQDFARANPGMDSQQLAAGINAAQTEFSVLANGALGRNREERIGRLLDVGRMAFQSGNDSGEFMRVEGLLAQSGLDTQTRDRLLRFTAGAAQRGAVEAGTVTRQAMPSITARVNTAISDARRGGGDPMAAAERAYAQSLAELEVARGMGGETPRAAGNALRDVQNRLRSSTNQENLLGNIRHSQLTEQQRTALTARLFEADPNRRGHKRLRAQFTDPLSLAQAFGEAGVSRSEFTNLVAGGGHGNPRSLLANQSRVVGGLLDQNTEGRFGWQNVRDLTNVNTTSLTRGDLARGADVFGNDTAAREQQRIEERGALLTDNTNALVRLTEKIDNLSAAHPFLSPAATSGASFLGGALLGRAGGAIGRVFGALGAGGASAAGAAGTQAAATGAPSAVRALLGTVGGSGAASALGTALGAIGIVAGGAANAKAALTGESVTGRHISLPERLARGAAAGAGPLGASIGLADLASRGGRAAGQMIQATFTDSQVQTLATAMGTAVRAGARPTPQDVAVQRGRDAVQTRSPAP